MQVTSLLLLVATTAIATAQSSGVYNYVLHILNHAIQSASMDNFVNLIQQLIYLSTVMMENGDGSVPQTASGILICQWLPVQNWATEILVSQLFVWIN